MNIKEFLATALAAAITDRVQLGSQPVVISAPPSQVSEYPTIAVWIEQTEEDYSMPGAVLQSADGTVLEGGAATDDDGNILTGTPVMLASGVTVTSIGTLRCRGRIWVGSRYVGKREEAEWGTFAAFNQDDSNRGRLLLPLTGCKLGMFTLYFGTAAADISGSSWTGEHAFEARLWSWRPFTLDAPMLVPRYDPIATSLVLEFSRQPSVPVTQPTDVSDVSNLTDLEKYLVGSDGSLTVTTI